MMARDIIDNKPLNFGKYKGKSSNEVAAEDPWYIVWMYETIKPERCSASLYKDCKRDADEEDLESSVLWEIHTEISGDH
jgi:hypothetical protein